MEKVLSVTSGGAEWSRMRMRKMNESAISPKVKSEAGAGRVEKVRTRICVQM